MPKIFECIRCKGKVSENSARYGSGLCKKCFSIVFSGKNSPKYREDSATHKKYYCIDCKEKEIHSTTALYGKGRCVECYQKWEKGDNNPMSGRTGEDCPNFKGGKPKCEVCGIEINYGHKRCRECSKNQRSKGKEHYLYKDGRSSKKHYCIEKDCGKELKNIYAERCPSCAMKYKWENGILDIETFKKRMIGKNNPNWVEDRNLLEYPLEFNDQLKESIRKRDNHECQNCGMTEEEHLIVYGKVLSVHHIDYNKKNCNENNLITTCFSCNIRANYNRNYWQELYKNKIKEIINA